MLWTLVDFNRFPNTHGVLNRMMPCVSPWSFMPMTSFGPLMTTNLPLPQRRQGKVRDIYSLPGQTGDPSRLVIVATDRISAFDVVLPTPIPGKGRLLTQVSLQWFEFIRRLDVIGDHLVSSDPGDIEQLSAWSLWGSAR